MIIRPSAFKGLKKWLSTRYKITPDGIFTIRYNFLGFKVGTEELRLKDVTSINFDGGVFIGRIIFNTPSGKTLIWDDVEFPNSVKKKAERAIDYILKPPTKPQNNEVSKNDNAYEIDPGDKVLFIPPIPDLFDRPLWLAANCKVGYCPEYFFEIGDWVSKNDILCSFPVYKQNRSDKNTKLQIKAPCNGILIHQGQIMNFDGGIKDLYSYKKLEQESIWSRNGFVLLIDKDEILPTTTKSIMQEFYDNIKEVKSQVFFQQAEFKNSNWLTDEKVNNRIELLINAPLIKYSVQEYKDIIIELQKSLKNPAIRNSIDKIKF